MIFAPKCRNRVVATRFPPFKLFGNELQYVESFKYLGHIIDNNLCDSSDIDEREIRNLFMRTNILLRLAVWAMLCGCQSGSFQSV